MIISVWRYSHLALAVSSFLLLTLAALTGIVLAFEPVMQQAKGYKADGFDSITLAQAIPALRDKLHGLQEIKVDEHDFVTAKFSDTADNEKTAYIQPLTGAVLDTPQAQSPFFKWVTALHRSLFLHETGRLIVGITAFLLILIVGTGIALIIKRQQGIRRFFAPVERTGFAQYYHTVFGRASLLFVLALALTGTFLSVSRFLLKPEKKTAVVDEENIRDEPQIALKDFAIFQQIKLAEVESIAFPFSDFPEDYYTLKLKDREVCVNQFTGEVLAQEVYSKSYNLTAFSLRWHTGRSNSIWAILMAITAAYILFFIYSGLAITWKRIGGLSKNKHKVEDSEIVILVGSENGSTFRFGNAIARQLIKSGKKVFLTDLDQYTLYPKGTHLVVMTSTYGDGEAPDNAKKFLGKLSALPQQQSVEVAVIGFGSRKYAQFCRFAQDLHQSLAEQPWTIMGMDMMTVDEGSPQDFSNWLMAFTNRTGFALAMPPQLMKRQKRGLRKMTLLSKSAQEDGAFLLQLGTSKLHSIRSGDLLAVYPKNDYRERLYSIGKVDSGLQLAVKYYENGLGSSYLLALSAGDQIKARVIRNEHFHLPPAKKVLMICNGTGIAPFLGMICEQRRDQSLLLYCGFRTAASFALYKEFLQKRMADNKLESCRLALSREGDRAYVSDLLLQDQNVIEDVLRTDGVIMICGSLSMQKDVLAVIEALSVATVGMTVEELRHQKKILTDCY